MTIDVTVDLQTSVSFRHFWRSTGLSPAALLLEPEMHMALALLGSVPRRGIEYVRVHYLLDLVTVDAHGYNFTYLDRALDAIINTHLLPFFELMGNPSERFTDFEDDNQVRAWADFVEETISRYLARYGQDTVRRWYFETWNEPDLAWWQFGDIGLNNYYDACVEGLQRVDPHLRIGGPGTARTLSPRFKQFLAHCDSGINYFTGEVGTRLDFISVHEKGVKSHPEDLTPDTDGICQRELQAVNYIREHHPKFADVPFINNECDPQVGWRQYHSWRGLPYTAAIICKIVAQHQTQLVEGSVDVAPAGTSSRAVNYALLSNDNGFLGTWGHRTHFTYVGAKIFSRAQAEYKTDLASQVDATESVELFGLIQKPAFTVMALLAHLGDEKLACKMTPASDTCGVLATRRGEAVIVLVYSSDDSPRCSGQSTVNVQLEELTASTYQQATFALDEQHGNPFARWEALGALDDMPEDVFGAVREVENVALIDHQQITPVAGHWQQEVEIPLPGVRLLVLEPTSTAPVPTPYALSLQTFPALHGKTAVLISWRIADSHSLLRFHVYHADDTDGERHLLTSSACLNLCFVDYQHKPTGAYAVQAEDLWGNQSELAWVSASSISG